MASNNHYLMLTGATGLLGRSLLRDLAAAGRRIAVLVRPSKGASAFERIDELLLDWQEVAGANVPFPVVLTGDITQVDLAPGQLSGLVEASDVLDGVEGVAVCRLTSADVVRHPLVQRVVEAYAKRDERKADERKTPRPRHR